MHPRPHTALTLERLTEIDHLFVKAQTILGEARARAAAFDYDLAVRRAQEAFELYVKSAFRFLGAEYPQTHDAKKQFYELAGVLREYNIAPREVAQVVVANSTLASWRLPALYGDESLAVTGLFTEQEAGLSITYVERAATLCNLVRSHQYRKAVAG